MNKKIFNILVAIVLMVTSCGKDDNKPEPSPNPEPNKDTMFVVVPINIEANISGSTFSDGDALLVTNTEILVEPATLTLKNNSGNTAVFAGDLKVKESATLASGTTKLTAALTSNNDENAHNHGLPTTEVTPISSLSEGLAKYGYFACNDFIFNSNGNTITLTLRTAFIEFSMDFTGAKVLMTTKDKRFYRYYLPHNAMFALPDGTLVESQILNISQTINIEADGYEYSVTRSLPEDCIPGVFSVSGNRQVFFSKGNLQYCPYDDSWRLAPEQYIICFNEDHYVGVNYQEWQGEGQWIDLFGYGSWLDGEDPTCTDTDYESYYPACDYDMNFEGDVYIEGDWQTLSAKEWEYLLGANENKDSPRRTNASDLYHWATVFGVPGFLILPDESTVEVDVEYSDKEEWAELEAEGALFLPLEGYRFSDILYDVGTCGYYWSSSGSYEDDYNAIGMMLIPETEEAASKMLTRANGQSVRLVKNIE